MEKPIRKEGEITVKQDPWLLNETALSGEEISHVVEDGSLNTVVVKREVALDCGCLVSGGARAAGYCMLCVAQGLKGLHCDKHITMCEFCFRLTCTGHLVILERESEHARTCGQCYEAMQPTFFQRVLGFLIGV